MPATTVRPVGSLAELEEAFNLAGSQFDRPFGAHDGTRTYLDLAENEEVDALVRGPLAGMDAWRTSYEGIPQLRVHLTRVDREFRDHIESLVTGCHVGLVMAKELALA